MSEPQDKEGQLENLEHEAAGFMNPFKWGKKKKEEEEAKKAQEAQAQAQASAAPPQAAPPPAAPPITEPAAATPKPAPPPAAATPKAPPAAKAERTYKVKSGDTLWDIAAQYYGDGRQYTKIAKANNIANPNLINVGVVLKIPD